MEIPERVKKLIDGTRNIAFATVDKEGMPNVVPMLQYWWLAEDTLVIADFLMKKSKENVLETGKVCIAVWDDTGESYKLKGNAAYETSGPGYDLAKRKIQEKTPDRCPKGVVVIKFTEVYNTSRGPKAGELIAKA
ncbi:MAG: pyridoxamine 5'-phosphate oxidase family protein [candidate division WOR-3 bacterium]